MRKNKKLKLRKEKLTLAIMSLVLTTEAFANVTGGITQFTSKSLTLFFLLLPLALMWGAGEMKFKDDGGQSGVKRIRMTIFAALVASIGVGLANYYR
jgi:hypothetical protein